MFARFKSILYINMIYIRDKLVHHAFECSENYNDECPATVELYRTSTLTILAENHEGSLTITPDMLHGKVVSECEKITGRCILYCLGLYLTD